MKKNIQIVVGLGFGDEGKGLATNYLCQKSHKPLVIRYNGGQQAGHTVVLENGTRHVFSNFGAGSLVGVPTFWSKFCTFSPTALINEYKALINKNIHPKIFVDIQSPVTTHYDILFNKLLERSRGINRHGSCGLGFGVTIERHSLSPYKLHAGDLKYADICAFKLKQIKEYYKHKCKTQLNINFEDYNHDNEDNLFLDNLKNINQLVDNENIIFTTENEIFSETYDFETYIFEGAQGVLLDMDFGYFPHVTRSNTTSKNAIDIISANFKDKNAKIEMYYISRVYHTRHGQGPGLKQDYILELKNNELETNVFNEFQQDFRVAPLNIDLVRFAIMCDSNFSSAVKKNLLLTCTDQVDKEHIPCFTNNKYYKVNLEELANSFNHKFDNYFFSNGDKALNIKSLDNK